MVIAGAGMVEAQDKILQRLEVRSWSWRGAGAIDLEPMR